MLSVMNITLLSVACRSRSNSVCIDSRVISASAMNGSSIILQRSHATVPAAGWHSQMVDLAVRNIGQGESPVKRIRRKVISCCDHTFVKRVEVAGRHAGSSIRRQRRRSRPWHGVRERPPIRTGENEAPTGRLRGNHNLIMSIMVVSPDRGRASTVRCRGWKHVPDSVVS